MDTSESSAPILQMRGMCKRFPGVDALRDVDLDLYAGECLAVCGENGAGKSTLIKLLGGAFHADAGEIRLFGAPVQIRSPAAAQRMGISIIYQEFNLIPELTARENIFLGREVGRFGFPDRRRESATAWSLFERIGMAIDPESRCSELNVAEQQAVEIAKALSWDARVIVMDEPSATLTEPETRRLFQVIRDLKADGIGLIFISHRLDEIFEVAERVLVLRDGRLVSQHRTHEVCREELINRMVGRSLDSEFPRRSVQPGREVLRVENLRRGRSVRGVNFGVRAGEVLGLAGLVGAGRTDTVRLIFGADRLESGTIFIDGSRRRIGSPQDAIRNGICLLTEDRKAQGLVLDHSARENFGLPNLDQFSSHLFIDHEKEKNSFEQYVRAMRIQLHSFDQPARTLSGGNQQKVVLAKWLVRNSRIVIFDEPTRGIDVGAKYEIYQLINDLASQGKAIIMISSELPEILGMSNRVIVMHEGEVKAEINDVGGTGQEELLAMMVASGTGV
jgi:ribose transport system ATP-binding protein